MAARQHDAMIEDGFEQDDSAKRVTLKRRGLIAGAAALVAGIVATRTAAPVAAGTDGDIALDVFNNVGATTGVQANEPVSGIFASNWSGSPVFKGDASLLPDSSTHPAGTTYNVDGIQGLGKGTGTGVVGNGGANSGIGVYGFGAGTAAGVQGFGGNVLGAPGVVGVGNTASANNGEGVRGFGANGGVGVSGRGGATNATGVIGFGGGTSGQGVAGIGASGTGPGIVGVGGNFGASNNADGVQGFANGTGGGVVGHGGGSNGPGLLGFGGAANGQGVAGIGNGTGPGIVGVGGNFVATNNADGVRGFASGTGTGVFGHSPSGLGVYGFGQTYGVRGDAGTAAGAAGLLGVATTANAVAFGSVVVAPATIAGYFNGEVHVEGPFYVDPISNKHGVIAKADGTKHVFYSMESPESWVEDFGTGTLANGKATIALDKDFASVIHADDYLVFLTSHDAANKGLAVTAHKVDGFTVQEQQGGTSSGSFSYRVVARPNVGKKVERMPKYTPPPKVDIAGIGKPIPPLAPPVIEARPVPAVVKRAEPPVLPDARQPNPPKKP